jgi:multimeric flavodoxin WrbA
MKLIVINGSYRKNGTTTKCLTAVSEKLAEKYNLEISYFFLENNIRACINCGPGNCIKNCRFKDQFQKITKEIEEAPRVLIGTPVYLDFPTPKTLAFLSRLNSLAEPTESEFFQEKCIHLHANGYCSGTKAAIRVMMTACEMLGFTIEGRSTTEFVEIWPDGKIRGGMTRGDACFIE